MAIDQAEADGLIVSLGADFTFVETEPGVEVRLMHIQCERSVPVGRVLFLAGWMSFSDAWRLVVSELRKTHEVYYLESREKLSSRVPKSTRFRISDLVHDYRVVAEKLGVNEGYLDVVASSVGAATVIRGFVAGARPRKISMISPVLRPEVPPLGPILGPLSFTPLYKIARSVAAWWYGMFIYRISKDDFQRSRFYTVLNGAEPWKMIRGARDIYGLSIPMSEVAMVDVPVQILGASTDPQHPHSIIEEIVRALPKCSFEDLKMFRRTHSKYAGRQIANFLAGSDVYPQVDAGTCLVG